MKRGDEKVGVYLLVCLVLFLLLLTPGLAKHTATLTLTPETAFETVEQEFNITVNNFGSKDEIILVTLTGDLSVTNVTWIPGWSHVITDTGVRWENGSVEGNVVNALFQFKAEMDAVNANETKTLTIITKDEKKFEQTHNKNVIVTNDDVPPSLSNADPAKDSFVQPSDLKNVSITAIDNETGINNVTFAYQDCADANLLVLQSLTTVTLDQQGTSNSYAKNINFSSFSEGEALCFTYQASDLGGGSTTYTGNVTFDETSPTVTLVSPEENGLLTASDSFSFNFSDNLAGNGTCTLQTNSTDITSIIAITGTNSVSAANATEGTHAWQVSCEDPAGNSAVSGSRTYKLDKSGPDISFVNLPSYFIRGSTLTVNTNITDLSTITSVTSTYTTPSLGSFALNVTQNGDIYGVEVGTAVNTTPENYTFDFEATDQHNLKGNNTAIIPVVYGYSIDFTNDQTTINLGNDAAVSGSIKFDNGSLVPQGNFTLYFPDGSALVSINNETGAFSHTYPGPNSTGNYEVTANITAGNGIMYSKTSDLVVNQNNQGNNNGDSNGGSSRGDSRSRSSAGDSAGRSVGSAPSSSTGSTSSASTGTSSASTSSASTGASAGTSSASTGTSSSAGSSDGASGGAGVGKATGFLTGAASKYSKLIWSFLILVIIVGALLYISREDGFKVAVKKKDHAENKHLSLEQYLKNRLK